MISDRNKSRNRGTSYGLIELQRPSWLQNQWFSDIEVSLGRIHVPPVVWGHPKANQKWQSEVKALIDNPSRDVPDPELSPGPQTDSKCGGDGRHRGGAGRPQQEGKGLAEGQGISPVGAQARHPAFGAVALEEHFYLEPLVCAIQYDNYRGENC